MFETIKKKIVDGKVLTIIKPRFSVAVLHPIYILLLTTETACGYNVDGAVVLKPEIDLEHALNEAAIALTKQELTLPWWFMASPWVNAPMVGHELRDYRSVDHRHIERLATMCEIDIHRSGGNNQLPSKSFTASLSGLELINAPFTNQMDAIQRVMTKLREMESYRLFRLLNTQDDQWNNAPMISVYNRDVRHALANGAIVLPIDLPNFRFTFVLYLGQQYARLCMRYPDLAGYNIAMVPSELVRDFMVALPTYMEPVVLGG